jgi:hypothetical protein
MTAALAELTERQRAVAVNRWQLLRPVVEDGIPLTAVAHEHAVLIHYVAQAPNPVVSPVVRFA